jgi:hypothetical protein
MGDKTVFQQQARMQSAQLEQNQQLMAQNAQQINLQNIRNWDLFSVNQSNSDGKRKG